MLQGRQCKGRGAGSGFSTSVAPTEVLSSQVLGHKRQGSQTIGSTWISSPPRMPESNIA